MFTIGNISRLNSEIRLRTKVKQMLRCARALPFACMVMASASALHATAGDNNYHWTRAELKTQSDLVVKQLKTRVDSLPAATALLVCPGVQASRSSTSECLLEEDGNWRAYYQLEVSADNWRAAAKAPQAVVYVLHTSKAFVHLLNSQAWSDSSDGVLSATDFSVLLVAPEQIEVAAQVPGAKLKKIVM